MQITTIEGVVENGTIRLKTNINLPDKLKVYVIIPGLETKEVAHVYSPHLVHPEQAIDFKKEVIEESPNAGV
ncbi:MAG: hypothetical protein JXA42_01270 [Anaerolineales bacterium]|nr:hypothetical protein [Anaerolineales bacterium]